MRPFLRRAAAAALLVAAGAATFVVAPRAFRDDGASPGRDATASRSALDPRPPKGVRDALRSRERVRLAGEDADAASPRPGATDGEAVAAGKGNPGPDPNSGAQVAGGALPNPADFALRATPDVDAASGVAPVVAPGRPPTLDLAAYVARGAGAVERAAELKGERSPVLDDGVPISLTGRVVEADGGAPVAGARVVVLSTFYARYYFYDHHLREVARAETDADGSYAVERLDVDPAHFGPGGNLCVTVTAEGHAPALSVPLAAVTTGVANRLPDVALRRATRSIAGRVIDIWEGKPVAGARVLATGAINPITYPKDQRPALFLGAPAAVTDEDGRFALDGVGDGVETLSAHAGDDCLGWTIVAPPAKDEVVLRARQIRGRIEGTTVDAHGDPVQLVQIEGGDNGTHSFADGRFVLANFRGDSVGIRFTHPDFAPVDLEGVRDGTTGLVVRLERMRPEIVLEVRDRDTDAPLTHVRVEFAFAEGARPPAPTSPERLSPAGRYAVRVPEGATELTVAAERVEPARVTLSGRADGETVRVVLGPARGQ